jgi:Skp family chaperone for outer membrane proteins
MSFQVPTFVVVQLKTRTEVATEQEKVLQQRESEIARFRGELNKQAKVNDEVAELRSKNEEKELTIKNNEQSNKIDWSLILFRLNASFLFSYILSQQTTERPSAKIREYNQESTMVFNAKRCEWHWP